MPCWLMRPISRPLLRLLVAPRIVNIVRQLGRRGKTLHWDPVAERFTNCDEGNLMLSRPRRPGYELPSIA